MSEPLGQDVERKIIEEGGMTVDSYRETIENQERTRLNSKNLQNFVSFFFEDPASMEDAKAVRIKEKLESERKKAAHAAMMRPYIRWLILYDHSAAGRRSMEIEVDEGANANFLTEGMATDRRLQVQSLEKPFRGETINGDLVCYNYAMVSLYGGDQDQNDHIKAQFYILPADAPPNDPRIEKPIVGRHLVHEAGHLLLTKDPKNPVRPTKMGEETKLLKEQSKQEKARVEEYEANASRIRVASRKDRDDNNKKIQDRGSSSQTGDKK